MSRRYESLSLPPTVPTPPLAELERIATSRSRAANGAILLVVGVLLLYPSWKMFVFVVLFLICGLLRLPSLRVCVFTGLPYGKTAPVVLACKPWWHTIVFPLYAEIRSMWTGIVSRKSAHRMEMIGRVRVLLVADTWYLQCGDPKCGWRIDVRAPVDSPLWRTCYMCPLVEGSNVPPPSSDGGWKHVGAGGGKKVENSTLHLEIDTELVSHWFRRRQGRVTGEQQRVAERSAGKKRS